MKAIHAGELEAEHLVLLLENTLNTTVKMPDNEAVVERLLARFNCFLRAADKRSQLAFFYIILLQEIPLQDFISEELTASERKFFTDKWLPYGVRLTESLRTFALHDVTEKLCVYSDSLATCWRLQAIAPQQQAEGFNTITPITLLRTTRK
jgi:hypothetical protein